MRRDINTIIFALAAAILFPGFSGEKDSLFYNRLERELRLDYLNCTGDTAHKPIEELVVWKHSVDSMLGTFDLAPTGREYQKRTGRSPVKDGPCAVALWKREYDSIAAIENAIAAEKEMLRRELDSLPRHPSSFAGIPFGISRESFVKLAGKAGLTTLAMEGDTIICPAAPMGDFSLPVQFHFNKSGKLIRYEYTSPPVPLDSLDNSIWPLIETIAAFYTKIMGIPPTSVNRIGRQEIVEGSLSPARVWSFPQWSVVLGISVKKFRYSAHLVGTNKPAP